VNGRKRHLLVDTTGLVVKALVHPASVPDGVGGQRVLEAIADRAEALPRLRHLWVDTAYQGRFKDWVEQTLGWTVAVVRKPRRWFWVGPGQEPPALEGPPGFQPLPRRWVVERTFGWIGRWRRTSKDYEFLPTTAECVIYAIMTRLMLRRLAQREACYLLRHPLGDSTLALFFGGRAHTFRDRFRSGCNSPHAPGGREMANSRSLSPG